MTVAIDGVVIETPAHDKLLALKGKNLKVEAFVQWLLGMYTIGNYHEAYGHFQEATVTIDDLLARYYGISSSELEQEKAAIMRVLRGER